jgi:methionyl-tRNA formyltransferase
MKIVYFGNNRLGGQILEWLQEQGEQIAGVVLHPPDRRKHGPELARAAGRARLFDGSALRQPETVAAIRALEPDIGLSVLFGYILRREVLELFPRGVVNLHPALLPYNRGACPNVWSIVERTPAGVSLHYIDERIDTGDLIAQQEVAVEAVDTGESLYRKLEHAALDLFRRTWPRITSGAMGRVPQPAATGTCHAMRDLGAIEEIDLDRSYTARELIDILRARTFAPYPGAWFRDAGRRVQVRVQLEYGD